MKKIYALAAVAAMAFAANAQDLYIVGAWEDVSWDIANPGVLTLQDGVYKGEFKQLSQFKLSNVDPEGSWDTFNANVYGCDYGDVPGVEVALVQGKDDNIYTPWNGDYTVEVAADLTWIKLSTDTPAPEGPINVFFRGEMNDWGAVPEWQFQLMDGSDDIYVFNTAADQVILAATSFKIADDDWKKVNYGLSDGEELYAGVETPLAFNGGNMSLSEEWEGTAYFQLSTGTLYLGEAGEECPFDESAVNNIQVENNGVATYYNLQGVRVANPENGLFIIVKDGKAVKSIIR